MDLPKNFDLSLLPPENPALQSNRLERFQYNASNKLCYAFLVAGKSAIQLIGGTGVGKTWIGGNFLARLKAAGKDRAPHNTFTPYPFWWITTANCVEPVRRELTQGFGLQEFDDFWVTNYDQLRSKEGEKFFSEKTVVRDGVEVLEVVVQHRLLPRVIIIDESQKVKNPKTKQHRYIQAIIKLPREIRPWIIFMSATPWTRVIDAKCFVTASEIPLLGFPVDDSHWDEVSANISTDGDPMLHSPKAIGTLRDLSEDWIIDIPTITGKYRAYNSCKLIDFKNVESRARYLAAWERFEQKCAKMGRDTPNGHFEELVALGQFRQAAELERAEIFADEAVSRLAKDNKSIIIAAAFRGTIARCVRYMIKKHGVKREDISLIWGGDDSFEQSGRLTQKEIMDYGFRIAKGEKLPEAIWRKLNKELATADEDVQEIKELAGVKLDLGSQSREQRQREIDRFQTSRTRICLFTQASGGTGVSLHHTNQWFEVFYKKHFTCLNPTEAPEHREYRSNATGKVFRSYPRYVMVTPTYSGQDFVQTLGRGHRSMFSLSDTYQDVCWFRNTKEEDVMDIVQTKLHCLSKAIKQRETWHDVLRKPKKERMVDPAEAALKAVNEEYIAADGDVNEGESEQEENE